MTRFKALALQVTCEAVNKAKDKKEVEKIMYQTLERLDNQIRASIAFIGKDTKLIVLPEYFLSSFPLGETMPQWREKACLEIGGKIYDRIGEIAHKHGSREKRLKSFISKRI